MAQTPEYRKGHDEDRLDAPIAEVAAHAHKVIEAGGFIFQKFTCEACGSRQTMPDANMFYFFGGCEDCGHVTEITRCNFMALASLGEAPGQLEAFLRKEGVLAAWDAGRRGETVPGRHFGYPVS